MSASADRARGREPVRIGAALQRYVKRLDREGNLGKAAVVEVWDRVAGQRIAGHTAVRGMRGAELLVDVDSAAWAGELSLMAEELRRKLNETLGRELVGRVRFTVSQTVLARREGEDLEGLAARRYGQDRVEPERLTAEEREVVERSVQKIQGEALREAARRATIRSLEWKKGLESPNEPQRETEERRGPNIGEIP